LIAFQRILAEAAEDDLFQVVGHLRV
jgi:hypothetical protein